MLTLFLSTDGGGENCLISKQIKGEKGFGKQHHHRNCRLLFGNKSVLNNLKTSRSDFDSAHAATSSQAIAEEEQMMEQKLEPKKNCLLKYIIIDPATHALFIERSQRMNYRRRGCTRMS